MPTYDGGTNGVDRTSKKPTAYKITKQGTTSYKPGTITRSADALQSGSDIQVKQGYTFNGPDANKAFAWDPQRKTYVNANSYSFGSPPPPSGGLPPRGPGIGSSGGGGGGGFGGGGGVNPADYTKYAAAMKQLLQSNLFSGPQALTAPAALQNPLTGMIDPAVDKDIATARGAYSGIADQVSMADPYLNLIAHQAPQMSPELAQFAASQGVGGDYAKQLLESQGQLAGGAENWANLAKILGTNHVAGQQSVVDNARLQGENIVQGYEGQRTGLKAMAGQQQLGLDQRAQDQAMQVAQLNQQQAYAAQQAKAQAIMQLIASGLPYGQAPDLAGLI